MLPEILRNRPDEFKADGPFEVRPEWPYRDDDDDSWEVARPQTKHAWTVGVLPGAICCCSDRATAEAIRDALNAAEAEAVREEVACTCRRCHDEAGGRMFLCAECGNKRCPHATDHRHTCTGSNEPGQEGSAYA